MIRKLEINEYDLLKETSIRIDCGLLQDYSKNEFIKKLVDLIGKYEKIVKE